MKEHQNNSQYFLRAKDVAERLNIGVSTLHAKAKTGELPHSIKFAGRISVWGSSEIDLIIDETLGGRGSSEALKDLTFKILENRKNPLM